MISGDSGPSPLRRRSSDPSVEGENSSRAHDQAAKVQRVKDKSLLNNPLLQGDPLSGRVKPGALPPIHHRDPNLQAWLDDPAVTGHKQEAVERIEHALRIKSKDLNLDGLDLSQAPPLGPLAKQLQHLHLAHNCLTECPGEALKALSKLKTLDLSNNHILEVGFDIGVLKKLTVLNLSNNDISQVAPEINRLTKLEELDLSGNEILWFCPLSPELSRLQILTITVTDFVPDPDKAFAAIQGLRIIKVPSTSQEEDAAPSTPDVAESVLQGIDSGICIHSAEESIVERPEDLTLQAWLDDPSITGNKQEAVRRIGIAKQSKSRELNLSDLELTQVPPLESLAKTVRYLNLSGNHLRTLPVQALTALPKLRILVVSNNKINALPPSIGELKHLKFLNLSYNRLHELPEELGALKELQHLFVAHNDLWYLPSCLLSFPDLQTLAIFGNRQIEDMPLTLLQRPGLRIIRHTPDPALKLWLDNPAIKGNKQEAVRRIEEAYQTNAKNLDLSDLGLTHLPPLGSLAKHLVNLDLTQNLLTEDSLAPLKGLSKLKVLFLAENRLKTIPAEIGLLHSLVSLDLSDNQLSELPEEIGMLSNLEALFVANNDLWYFPGSLVQLSHLELLDISGNQQVIGMPFTALRNPKLEVVRSRANDGTRK